MRRWLGTDWAVAIPFVGPMVILILLLIAYPFLDAIRLSFTTRQITNPTVFVGLQNYADLLQDRFFKDAVKNTVLFTVYSEVFKISVGLIAALLLHNVKRGRTILTGLVLLPWIVPTVVTALAWRSIYDPLFGGLNYAIESLHLQGVFETLQLAPRIPASWLGDRNLAMPSIILVNVWKGIPFFTINFLAGLKSIDADLYEAASVDGATVWQKFVNITLPGLRNVMMVAVLLTTIWTFNSFDVIYLLTGGGPGGSTRTYIIFAYEKAIQGLQFGPGAAVPLLMMPFFAVLIFFVARNMTKNERVDENSWLDRFFARYGQVALLVIAATVIAFVYLAVDPAVALVLLALAAFVAVFWFLPEEIRSRTALLVAGLLFAVWLVPMAVALVAAWGNVPSLVDLVLPYAVQAVLALPFAALALVMSAISPRENPGTLVIGTAVAGLLFALDRSIFVHAVVILAVILFFAYFFGRWAASVSQWSEDRRRASGKRRSTKDRPNPLGRIPNWIAMCLLLFVVLGPFYWIMITAFKSELQVTTQTNVGWPSPWTLEQFQKLLGTRPFGTWYANTIIVAVVTTVLAVTLAALGGYGLARLNFRGRKLLTNLVLLTYLLPGALLFIPLYQILNQLRLINDLKALMITYPTFALPFASWLLMGYFRNIPEELENAALVDGATRFQAFYRIILPLATPALLAVALFTFTNAWNEFLFAFVFISREGLKTLPVGLQGMIFGDIYPWGQLMAASILMAIPVAIVYSYAQRFLVDGLTAGSVKG